MFDLILRDGWVIDGSGGPPFRADVALRETLIADVGRLDGAQAPRVIDVEGRYVVPGFIDAHVHGDLMLLADPIHTPALRQGVTTYLIGQDGSSFAPASRNHARLHEAVHRRLQRQPGWPFLRLADNRRIPRLLRPPNGHQRRLPDPQRQRSHGGHGPGPPSPTRR